ncbi:hypothetical protein OC834_007119, partial [Tilletia horrida]
MCWPTQTKSLCVQDSNCAERCDYAAGGFVCIGADCYDTGVCAPSSDGHECNADFGCQSSQCKVFAVVEMHSEDEASLGVCGGASPASTTTILSSTSTLPTSTTSRTSTTLSTTASLS